MSRACSDFANSIEDAVMLLQHFDSAHKKSPEDAEVLKRAGLVMALTAWETFVEDRIREAVQMRLRALDGSSVSKFVLRRLDDELKRFHNPTSEKTKRLFMDFLEIDVTTYWKWAGYDVASAKKTLDDFIAKRGDAVHRSKPTSTEAPLPHLVKRDELDKAIRFLRSLVDETERALTD